MLRDTPFHSLLLFLSAGARMSLFEGLCAWKYEIRMQIPIESVKRKAMINLGLLWKLVLRLLSKNLGLRDNTGKCLIYENN